VTVADAIRAHLLARAGLGDLPTRESEWCPRFEAAMRARLVMGALRYGRMGSPGKPQYDRTTCAVRRLLDYAESGNLERLVDAANLCLLEFVEGIHPLRHFRADDDGRHTRRTP
jgi:hypothetical protein